MQVRFDPTALDRFARTCDGRDEEVASGNRRLSGAASVPAGSYGQLPFVSHGADSAHQRLAATAGEAQGVVATLWGRVSTAVRDEASAYRSAEAAAARRAAGPR